MADFYSVSGTSPTKGAECPSVPSFVVPETPPTMPQSICRQIPIANIRFGKYRLRRIRPSADDSHVVSLAASIKEQGLLQPIVVIEPPDKDYFELVAGEHRLTAVKTLGWAEIPAIVRDDTASALLLAFAENSERKQFDPYEEARALDIILKTGITETDLARKINKSQPYIANKLRLLKVPEKVACREDLTESHLVALIPLIEVKRKELKNPTDKRVTQSIEMILERRFQPQGIPSVREFRYQIEKEIAGLGPVASYEERRKQRHKARKVFRTPDLSVFVDFRRLLQEVIVAKRLLSPEHVQELQQIAGMAKVIAKASDSKNDSYFKSTEPATVREPDTPKCEPGCGLVKGHTGNCKPDVEKVQGFTVVESKNTTTVEIDTAKATQEKFRLARIGSVVTH